MQGEQTVGHVPLCKRIGLPRENFQYISRDVAARLAAQLHECPVVVLSGEAGVGKTELAKHYAYHPTKPYALILWLKANTEAGLLESCHAIRQALASELTAFLTRDYPEAKDDIRQQKPKPILSILKNFRMSLI